MLAHDSQEVATPTEPIDACAPQHCTRINRAADAIRAQFAALTRQIPAITYTARLDEWSTTLSISPQVEALLGFTLEEWNADPELWVKCLHPEDRERTLAELKDWRARGDSLRLEYRVVGRDGRVRWFFDQGVVVRDTAGVPVCLQGVMLDITERKETEARLRFSEERFRKLVESGHDVFIVRDLEGRCAYFNAPPALGLAPESVLGKTYYETFDRQTADVLTGQLLEAAQGKVLAVENWFSLPRGRFCFLETIYPIRDDAGRVTAVAKIARNITEQKKAEEALRRSEARSRALLETAPDGILLIDEHGRLESINPAAEELFGYGEPEAVGLDVRALIPAFHNVKPAGPATSNAARGDARNGEAIGRHRDGTTFPIDLAVGEVRLDDRRLFTAIVRDLTDRKVLQEQLFRAQKMEAVGRLAGGIAHDFNNYLTVVSCNIDLMEELLAQGAAGAAPKRELLTSLEQMRNAWRAATSLTRQLLAFSRRQVVQPGCLDVNGVVTEMERMLRPLIGEHIRLNVSCCHGSTRVRADTGQLEQVIMNLVVNARDAMPEGGALSVETSRERLPGASPIAEAAPGEYLCIKVADTGVGMTSEVLKHLYEPFYTTKAVGRGTGLGLPTVYGIVHQCGGHIAVHSEPGQGTTFRVYLPVAGEAGATPTAAPLIPPHSGRETLLVCEDEPAILRLIAGILKAKGYQVLAAGTPRRAMELAATHSGAIDLLVTDVIMPEMNGRRLAEALRADFPEMAVLYVSGYTADILSGHGVAAGEVELLQKPFTPADLLRHVRSILDRVKAQPVG